LANPVLPRDSRPVIAADDECTVSALDHVGDNTPRYPSPFNHDPKLIGGAADGQTSDHGADEQALSPDQAVSVEKSFHALLEQSPCIARVMVGSAYFRLNFVNTGNALVGLSSK
jgi:hypothetical protein